MVERYERHVASVARAALRPIGNSTQHFEDAKQAGLVGLLSALEEYDPARAAFWTFARMRVLNEIQQWIGVGLNWRKSANRGKSPQRVAKRDNAKAASLHVSFEAQPVENQQTDDRAHLRTPEQLVADAEEAALLDWFAGTLSEDDRAALLATDHRRIGSRHYQELVTRARAAIRELGGRS